MTKEKDVTSPVDRIGKTKLDEILNPKVNPKTNISVVEKDAFVRLVDASSGSVLELHLEIDPVEEVVVDAKYRLTDMPGDANNEDTISKLAKLAILAKLARLAELVKGKGLLFCIAISENDLAENDLAGVEMDLPGKEQKASPPLTALKLALSEYIMRKFAVSIGITKNREEFIGEYLKDHPMFDMLKKE